MTPSSRLNSIPLQNLCGCRSKPSVSEWSCIWRQGPKRVNTRPLVWALIQCKRGIPVGRGHLDRYTGGRPCEDREQAADCKKRSEQKPTCLSLNNCPFSLASSSGSQSQMEIHTCCSNHTVCAGPEGGSDSHTISHSLFAFPRYI